MKEKVSFQPGRKKLDLNKANISDAIDLLSNISLFFHQRKLSGSIFSENLFFSKEKSRTTRINEAVGLILAASKGFSQQKTGQLFKNLTLSGEVEITGVEPVTFCMPCKRSSQLS